MRIISIYDLFDHGGIASSETGSAVLEEIDSCIRAVVWPPGSDKFTIFPESGKKRGEGNGVKPIKDMFAVEAEARDWVLEAKFPIETLDDESNFGPMDASKKTELGLAVVEWETGNISSSHRAMNKMGIGLIDGRIVIGVLIVPTTAFAKYLTDRIGNLKELKPYFRLWANLSVGRGLLRIYAVQHDEESFDVERITKGTDGRARS